MKRYHSQYQGLATGARRMRDMADIRMQRSDFIGYNASTEFSGPIDAPETMPAGSCINTDFTNWRGRPVISQSEITR